MLVWDGPGSRVPVGAPGVLGGCTPPGGEKRHKLLLEREGVRLACTGRKNVGRVRQTNNERRQAWTETGNTRSRYLVVASFAVAPFHSRRPHLAKQSIRRTFVTTKASSHVTHTHTHTYVVEGCNPAPHPRSIHAIAQRSDYRQTALRQQAYIYYILCMFTHAALAKLRQGSPPSISRPLPARPWRPSGWPRSPPPSVSGRAHRRRRT